jgi:CRP-like cAMP-binding protein
MSASSPSTLRQSRIFDGLTDTERSRWLDRAARVALGRGQPLAHQGEPATTLSLVESGFLKVLQLTTEGAELIVRFVGPGEPFGGVVALGDAPYPVSAIAAQPTVVQGWSREAVAALLAETPQVRVNIMREMATHMTDALTRVRELTTARVSQRLATTLLRLARQIGQPDAEGVRLTQPLTRQELAELTGTTLYTVSRTLRRWEAEGLLVSRGRTLTLRSPERLSAAAAADDADS